MKMFKDRRYYINKIKEYAGIAATAILFDAAIIIAILIEIAR